MRESAGHTYGFCPKCMKRRMLLTGMDLNNARCACNGELKPYVRPTDMGNPPPAPRNPRMMEFWQAGREDGYWGEATDFDLQDTLRGVEEREAYDAGRTVGERRRRVLLAEAPGAKGPLPVVLPLRR